MAETLNKLLNPIQIEDFFSQYWEQQPLHIPRNNENYYSDILNVDQLDTFFQSRNVSPHFLRVLRNSADFDIARWTNLDKRSHSDPTRVLAVDKLFALFCQGATIILLGANAGIPILDLFCRDLSRELQVQIQPNIYITPPAEQGLAAHQDPHDVFVLQIRGSKRWSFYAKSSSASSPDCENNVPKAEIKLEPGDLLYVPRGTVHRANSETGSSVHITIGLLSRSWHSLVKDLADLAENDLAFQKSLPHGFTNSQQKELFYKEFSDALESLLHRASSEFLFKNQNTAFRRDLSTEVRASFKDILNVERLNLSSLVSPRPHAEYELHQCENDLVLKFGAEVITLPRFMREALESLLNSGATAVADIKGPLSDKSKLELVTNLVQVGLLRIESL